MNHAGDLRILLGHAIVGVDEHQCHIAPANGCNGAKYAVPLQGFILNGTLTANAGSIDDIVLRAIHAGKAGINGITSRSGNVGHHGALLSQQPVHQRAFAHIGTADYSQLHHMLCFFHFVIIRRRKMLADFIQQIAQAHHVDSTDGNGIPNAQLIELIHVVIHADVVNLVHHQNDRLMRLPQQVGHFPVVIRQAFPAIGKEADHIRRIHGDFCLTAHLAQQHIFAVGINAAGINQRKLSGQPFHIRIDTIPGNAGGILHDADAVSHNFIEKGRLANIGATNNRHKGSCH